MPKQIFKIFFLLALFLTLPHFVRAAVVFQTNFDNVPAWNPSDAGSPACWQNKTNDGLGCPAGNLPSPIFNDYRVQSHLCSSNSPVHIGSAADIQSATGVSTFSPYGGSGRSYVHMYESCAPSSGWGSDGLLGIYFGQTTGYSDLYVQFMVKFQPGFQFQDNNSQQKIAHIMHSEPNMFTTDGGATYHVDNSASPSGIRGAFNMFAIFNKPDLVPEQQYRSIYCANLQDNPNTYPVESGSAQWAAENPRLACESVNLKDGNWHTLRYHVKLNTAAGLSDGIAQTWIDGVLSYSTNSESWTIGNSPLLATYGFNRIDIGGNSDNIWSAGSTVNQWYAVDNWVVFTDSSDVPLTGTDGKGTYVPSSDVAPIPNGGSTDTAAPTVPANLAATATSSSQINLTWTASTDNVAVTGYKIYRGGTYLTTATVASFSDTGLSASTLYAYKVSAVDAAGNESAQSVQAQATTQAGVATFTVGLTNSNTSNDDAGYSNILVGTFANLPSAAIIQSISFYTSTAAGTARLGIYDATGSGGGPGTLKASTNEVALISGWNTVNVIMPSSLSAGNYWITYIASNTNVHLSYNTTGGETVFSGLTYQTLPGLFPVFSAPNTSQCALYATFSAATNDTIAPAAPTVLVVQ